MPNFSTMTAGEISLFIADFSTIANANLAALSYVAADITAINAKKTALDNAIAAAEAARLASVAATTALKIAHKAAQLDISSRSKFIAANTAVAPVLKAQLGLPPADTVPSTNAPVTPLNLAVTGTPDGTNLLKWKSNGNLPRTMYDIYAKIGAATAWTLVRTITATKFTHSGQTAGVKALYRITARRGAVESIPSNEAVIYE